MSVQIIPIGTGAYTSSVFSIPGLGSTVILSSVAMTGSNNDRIDVEVDDGSGNFKAVGAVTLTHPIYTFPGAGDYRLVRWDGTTIELGAAINIASSGGGSGGGGGDASASNQLTQINRAEQANSFLLDISNRISTADLQSAGNALLTVIRDNASTIAGRIAPISATVARKVAITSTATSIALSPAARYIDFRAVGSDAYYVISTGSPVATTESHYIGQDERLMRGVTANMSISVLSAGSNSGMLYITER